MSRPHLAVIVPAYDEQDRIGPSLARMTEYLRGQEFTWRLIVVSDGSTDDTEALVEQVAAEVPEVQLIAYKPNRGKGYAVRKGMLSAEADWLLFCDADLATPMEELEKLWPAVEDGTPIAIGSRPLRESQLEIRQPWYREFMGRAFNMAVQTLGIRGIADTQCGFKLFRHDACQEVFRRVKVDGFGFDFEALMIAHDLGLKIAEVPIRWQHKDGSKVSLVRDGIRMLRDLVRLRMMGKSRRLALHDPD
ncbi:MAG: glycosyltransferase family 2 protein [Fimbriimonadaceae bacterium]|nr:glycosyltransferase family 2 protein [Fimbriimonadaceae bacterium]